MGMFDWLAGAENAQTDKEDTSNAPAGGLRVETSESAKVIAETKRASNKQPESGSRTFTLESGDTAQAIAEQAKILDAILDPKVWRGAVAAPGDMMVAVTGKAHWELSQDERDTLAKTGAATARCFAMTDPKWLALTLFSFSVLTIYGGRVMKDLNDKRDALKNKPLQAQNVS
jgi:hypothetical protein